MQAIENFPLTARKGIEFFLTDIDDTLTSDGILTAQAYSALCDLQKWGLKIIPITGRPAGWCDHFARMWPIDAIVGENGAFYFRYDPTKRTMTQRFWKDEASRKADKQKLFALQEKILATVPGCGIASDQNYRETDLAIDFCEDVLALSSEKIDRIVSLFNGAGAQAKVSSIHVNGWFGNYNKLSMTRCLFHEIYGLDLDRVNQRVVFCGDSPNDAPMFGFFYHAVGVANVLDFKEKIPQLPRWVTQGKSGQGFVETAEMIIQAKQKRR